MLETKTVDDKVVVRPEGRITASNAEQFRQDLLEIVESGSVHITIDLDKIDILDSKGLAVFIVCNKTVSEKGGSLTVLTDNEDFLGLFRVMRLDEHFTVCESK